MALRYTADVRLEGENRALVTFTEYQTEDTEPPYPDADKTGWEHTEPLDIRGSANEIKARLPALRDRVLHAKQAGTSAESKRAGVDQYINEYLAGL